MYFNTMFTYYDIEIKKKRMKKWAALNKAAFI